MARVVLDASALLALLNEEDGAASVERALEDAVISCVNLSETAGVLIGLGMPPPAVADVLSDLALESVPFDEELALAAAGLVEQGRELGLSLGDRACIALAQKLKVPAVTADRVWAKGDFGIKVRLIR